jgi:hypothetical protein
VVYRYAIINVRKGGSKMTAIIRCFAFLSLSFAVFTLLVGCGGSPSTNTSDVRQARLWAEENLNVKADIKKLESQLAEQKEELDRSRGKCEKIRQELQAQCEKEKQQLQKDSDETTSFLMEKLPTDMIKQVAELQKENEALKQQLQQLSPKN